MARGINKVILIGNLGQDPEVRYTTRGNPVANANLATTDTWMDKQSGQRQEKTEWHRLVIFGKTAEIAQQYTRKGSKIYVEGRLQTRKWQDQSGQDKYTTEIVVNDMQMLDSGGGGQQQGGYNPQGGYGQGMPQQGYPQQPPQQPPQNGAQGQNWQQPPNQPPPQGQPQQPPQGQQPPPQQGNNGGPGPGAFDDFDDEIPFAPMHPMMGG